MIMIELSFIILIIITMSINASEILQKGYIDLRSCINLESPSSFLSRGDLLQLKWIMSSWLFETEWVFIKKLWFIIPEKAYSNYAQVVSQPEITQKKIVESPETIKMRMQNQAVGFQTEKVCLMCNAKSEVISEKNDVIDKQSKKIKRQEDTITQLQSKLDEKGKPTPSKNEDDYLKYQTSVSSEGKFLTVEELCYSHINLTSQIKSLNSTIELIKQQQESEFKSKYTSIIRENEKLQEDYDKLKKINDDRQDKYDSNVNYLKKLVDEKDKELKSLKS